MHTVDNFWEPGTFFDRLILITFAAVLNRGGYG